MHSSPIAIHSGFHKTYAHAMRIFFWEGMKKDILTFVIECDIFQRKKGETIKTLGALQLFSIPT